MLAAMGVRVRVERTVCQSREESLKADEARLAVGKKGRAREFGRLRTRRHGRCPLLQRSMGWWLSADVQVNHTHTMCAAASDCARVPSNDPCQSPAPA